jgi:hypothetical protein
MYICGRCENEFPVYMSMKSPSILNKDLCPICTVQVLGKLFKNPVISEEFRFKEEKARKYKASKQKQNMGGHMINPPKDCQYSHHAEDGADWVDLVKCETLCDGKCSRHNVFTLMTRVARIKELNRNGVIY